MIDRWAIRRAIAEAHGYTDIKETGRLDGQLVGRAPGNLFVGKDAMSELPAYENDLNAMHAVLREHFDQVRCISESGYESDLAEILCRDNDISYTPHEVSLWMATARQISEAFLKWHTRRGSNA